MQPAFEGVGLPKGGETPPDFNESLLNGIARRLAVTQDERRRADEASGHGCGQLLERLVFATLRTDDLVSHLRTR